MRALARTLLMLVLLSGQFLVLGQAFAMPHKCAMDDAAGAAPHAMTHHSVQSQATPSDGIQMDCHCPQGHHCGQGSAALMTPTGSGTNVPNAKTYRAQAVRATALGHTPALERPPPPLPA